MKEEDKSKLVEVFNGSLWEAELVKSLLENNGIESTLKDGMVVNIVLPETAVDVAVLVNEANYEAAMEEEGQDYFAEYLQGVGSEVLGGFYEAAVHFLQSVVDGVYHERQEVVDHTEHKGTFAQRQVQEVEQRYCGKRTYQDIHPHGEDEQHHHGA